MSSTPSIEGTGDVPDNRLFNALISETTANRGHADSVLADRYHECTYADLPFVIAEVRKFLVRSDIHQHDCIILQISNSTRAAVTVLSLLDAGYSFLTRPAPASSAQAAQSAPPVAKFCRWVVSVESGRPPDHVALAAPDTYLRVDANPHYDPSAQRPEPHDPRLFFGTSGSLGPVKLAMHGYRNFYYNMLNALERRRFTITHRISLPTPIFHVYGLGAGLLPGLAAGSSVDLQERSNVLKYFDREDVFQPNVAYVTPPFCEMLIRARRKPRPYEFMIVSGDRISESTFKRCEDLHGPMVNQYGTTEMGVVSASGLAMPFELRARTVGHPVGGVELRIVDIPAKPDATGEVGELQVRHAYGFEGYVDLAGKQMRPEKSFDGDWYRTGDLATKGPDGALIVLGRCDLSINRRGMLLPLAEVESRMREIDGVEEVAVAPGAENIQGVSLVAFCVTDPKVAVTGPQLRAAYAKSFPPHSVPDVVHLMDSLPKLASGKVDRQSLAKLAHEDVMSTQ